MKNIIKIPALFVAAAILFLSHIHIVQSAENEHLKPYEGTYLGFSPISGLFSADESNPMVGEIEITIKKDSVVVRLATGQGIMEETISFTEFKPITAQEVQMFFLQGSDNPARTVGFTVKKYIYLFTKRRTEDEFILMRLGGKEDFFGPTFLLNEIHVTSAELGELVQLNWNISIKDVARLRNGGRVEK